ncbi:MAG: sialidase family protein [bacterium]
MERWIHPLCEELKISFNGPFLSLKDGRLAVVRSEGIRFSDDGGLSWSEPIFICEGINDKEPASSAILQTETGVILFLYLNFSDYRFQWDEERGEPQDCKLELWCIRSQIRRWVSLSVYSDDEGKTWRKSNLIDLGGQGHHDGALEPTLVELKDGKLLMFIRTNLDRFWQAVSDDGGRYWRKIIPSRIDASSSPGKLLRLKSGRIALVWNRLNPEGGEYPKREFKGGTEFPASWHREGLSIAFSEDECESWTEPVVIARQKGGQLSYPYLFEPRPGELWIIAGFAFKKNWEEPYPLRLKIEEEKFIDYV